MSEQNWMKAGMYAGWGLIMLLLLPAVQGDGLILVENGASAYTIVKPVEASLSVQYAADELQSVARQLTGVELPVITDENPLPDKAILLGVTRYTTAVLGHTADLGSLGTDGFRLAVRSPHLCIVGSQVRGTLYGVYELLETYGGCHWFSSFYSVIPKLTTWKIPEIDDVQTPAFVMREPFWFDMFNGDFAARSRANGSRMELSEKHGGKIRFGGGLFVHTFYRLMPPNEFFADHPEYFSEINGKRVADHAQLCLTNPDVVRICTERLLGHIRSDPGARLYSLSQNDWHGFCTCPACRAIDEREGSPSGSLIHFVNQVAEQVEKEFPDVWIETLAYQYTRHPPKTLKPRANVVPRLCTIECDFSVPLDRSQYDQNVSFVKDIDGWSSLTDKLYIWDYTTNFGHYLGPHPNFHALQGNVKFFRDHHVVGLFEQGAYQGRHAEFAELRAWILAKLLWNPDQDIEPLYQTFFQGYYGAAASSVRAYFDELQGLVLPDEHVLRIWSPMSSAWYSDEFFDRAMALWQQAEDAVRDDPARLYNVRMGAMPVLYARIQRHPIGNVTFSWQNGMMRPTGVPDSYRLLAENLKTRLAEGGNVRIAESIDREKTFLAELAGYTTGYAGIEFSGAGTKAAVVPEFSGRICSLRLQDGDEMVMADQGGIDTVPNMTSFLSLDTAPFTVTSQSENSVAVQHRLRNRYTLTRTSTIIDGNLVLDSKLTNGRLSEQSFSPVIRAALALGDGAAVAVRVGETPWQTITVPADQVMSMQQVTADTWAGQEMVIASPLTRRGIRLTLPDKDVARVLLVCDVRNTTIRAFVLLNPFSLAAGAAKEFHVGFRPLSEVADLPAVPELPAEHRPDRIVVEDTLIPIGRLGEWGEYVPAGDTLDGSAAKLFNTHYEWCMQWRFKAESFEPGYSYRLRVRLRIDKSEREGEAFWAGVYDYGKKKECLQIAPRTSEVTDTFAWYDVGEWGPEDGQYIWIGPGRFNKAAGEVSAINALYIDRFELVRGTRLPAP